MADMSVVEKPRLQPVDKSLNAWVFVSEKDENDEENGEYHRAKADQRDLVQSADKKPKSAHNVEKVKATLENGKVVEVPKGDWLVPACEEDNFDEDMSSLHFLNNATVLHNLHMRLSHKLIHTYSGLFCVVVNPYTREISDRLYSDQMVEAYKGQLRHQRPPHLFAVADEAFRTMLLDGQPQSILCTGESGAGKTENTKKVIQYLTKVSSVGKARKKANPQPKKAAAPSGINAANTSVLGALGAFAGKEKRGSMFAQLLGKHWKSKIKRKSGLAIMAKTERLVALDDMEIKVINANEVLEPFGNAKTTRNDNSSRFGKFIKVLFEGGNLAGCSIVTYLLEKARVLAQGKGEANFHVFYYVLSSDKLRSAFSLKPLSSDKDYFYITNGPDKTVTGDPNNPETEGLARLTKFFNLFDVKGDDLNSVYKSVAGILILGNINFGIKSKGEKDPASLTDDAQKALEQACGLFGIQDIQKFQEGLCTQKIMGTVRQLTKAEISDGIGAIAKAMFERLFLFTVGKLNETLNQGHTDSQEYVGILDIAGFEIFEHNSFEQLCINFTNECLQRLFNECMFKREQKEYEKEHIEWNKQDYGDQFDLDNTIRLIDGGIPSVFSCLVDQCKAQARNPDDSKLVASLQQKLKSNAKFSKPRPKGRAHAGPRTDFAIQHYAGNVEYNCDGWITKNQDTQNHVVVSLLQGSSDSFISALWNDAQITELVGGSGKGKQYVAEMYSKSLKQLISTLESTKTHFVRCIKPNTKKAAFTMQGHMVLDQLKCNGVLEGIKIASEGYPRRVVFRQFAQQYGILAPEAAGQSDPKATTASVLKALENKPKFEFLKPNKGRNQYALGDTKVFFRKNVLLFLDEQRDNLLESMAILLQQRCRGFVARKMIPTLIHERNVRLGIVEEPPVEEEPVVEDKGLDATPNTSVILPTDLPEPANVPSLRSNVNLPGGHDLAEAAASGNSAAMNEVLQKYPDAWKWADASGRSALHWAAGMGQTEAMGALVAKGLHVSTPTKTGRTAMHIAAGLGEVDTMKWLVEHNASVLEKDVTGATALHKAAQWGQIDALEFLAQQGVDLKGTTKTGQTAVHVAARDGQKEAIQWLAQHGVELSTPDSAGKTPFHIAAEYDKTEALQFLAANHCDTEATDSNGGTALHSAAIRGSEESVEWLLSAGLAVDAVDNAKRTPLHLAAWQGRVGVVNFLVQNGANKNAKDEADLTPADYAKDDETKQALA